MTVSKTLLALAAAALSIASSAFAGPVPNNGAAAAAKQAAEGAQPFTTGSVARMAILYSPLSGTIRSKGVLTVTSPDVGIYCVTPMTAIRQTKFYQSVSPEWGWSSGNSLVAMARDNADGFTSCPNAGDFEVRTFDLTGNASGLVAFFLEVL
jgi:hypothetical protein